VTSYPPARRLLADLLPMSLRVELQLFDIPRRCSPSFATARQHSQRLNTNAMVAILHSDSYADNV